MKNDHKLLVISESNQKTVKQFVNDMIALSLHACIFENIQSPSCDMVFDVQNFSKIESLQKNDTLSVYGNVELPKFSFQI